MDTARCPRCGRTLPVDRFNRDASRSTGRAAHCKDCKAAKRRGALEPPRGLVLVMPPRPEPPPEPDTPPQPPAAGRTPGHYETEAEKFLAALNPPPGDADSLLVAMLRDVALRMDGLAVELDGGREMRQYTGVAIRLQRELAATRATKAKAKDEPKPAAKSKLAAFRDATG